MSNSRDEPVHSDLPLEALLDKARTESEFALVMLPPDTGCPLPEDGKNLAVVAIVQDLVHLRFFGIDGRMVIDAKEATQPADSQRISQLKNEIKTLWSNQLHKKSHRRVFQLAKLIVGSTVDTEPSFTLFCAISWNQVVNIAREKSRSQEEAEDRAQDGYIKALKSLSTWRSAEEWERDLKEGKRSAEAKRSAMGWMRQIVRPKPKNDGPIVGPIVDDKSGPVVGSDEDPAERTAMIELALRCAWELIDDAIAQMRYRAEDVSVKARSVVEARFINPETGQRPIFPSPMLTFKKLAEATGVPFQTCWRYWKKFFRELKSIEGSDSLVDFLRRSDD